MVQALDLGLSVKWADRNIGANDINEYGGYYGWADPTGNQIDPYNQQYGGSSEGGYYVDKTDASISSTKYDICTAKLGNGWRLPTKEEWDELINAAKNKWSYDSSSGIGMYTATMSNGNKIRFPHNGYKNYNLTEQFWKSMAFYWTGSRPDDSRTAFEVQIQSTSLGPETKPANRSLHMMVRAVYDGGVGPQPPTPDPDPIPVHDAIDLGLPSGTLWSKYNLGATDMIGTNSKYYAWGELGTKQKYYKEDYKFYDKTTGKHPMYPNYISGSEYYKEDTRKFDAAYNQLGGKWHIPTNKQWEELRYFCTWSKKDEAENAGWVVTGPSGHAIFIPEIGYYNGEQYIEDNGTLYWSDELYKFNSDPTYGYRCAYSAILREKDVPDAKDPLRLTWSSRHSGLPIRPVYDTNWSPVIIDEDDPIIPDIDPDDPDVPPVIDPDDYPDPDYNEDDKKGNVVLGEWNRGSATSFDGKLKCKLQYIVNKSPLVTKVFDDQEIVSYTRHDQNDNYVDNGLYFTNNHQYEWTTDLKQKAKSDNLKMTAREGNYRYAVPRDDNKEYGNRLRGKYMICTIEDSDPRIDASITYIITKFRASWN